MQIDGQTATQVGSYIRATDGGGNGPVLGFFRAAGTANTTFNVTFDVNFNPFDMRVQLWSLTGAGTVLATGSDSFTGFDTGLTLDVNTAAGGCVAAAIMAYNNTGTPATTWTGLTERFDGHVVYGNDWDSAADADTGSASTPLAASAAFASTNGAGVGLSVSFNAGTTNVTLTAAAGAYTHTGSTAGHKYVMPLGAAGE